MNILLVEDEAHKREELTLCIREVLEQEPTIVDAVSNAVHAVKTQVFDIIVLDMALSTFGDSASDDKKGHDQALQFPPVLDRGPFYHQMLNPRRLTAPYRVR